MLGVWKLYENRIWVFLHHLQHERHPFAPFPSVGFSTSRIMEKRLISPSFEQKMHVCQGQKSLYMEWSSHLQLGILTMGI